MPEQISNKEIQSKEDPADNSLTDLQNKAIEIAKQYKNLPLQDKIGIIAQAFNAIDGTIKTTPCTGKWRGTSDISIKFDNGTSLFIGNHRTPLAKTVKVQTECVNAALAQYNPEIIAATKEAALGGLRKREAKDNEIAAQKGLKPYTLLNVEFNDGTDEKNSVYMGWYYVTLAIDGKIRSFIETDLNYDIRDGKVSENLTRENYFAVGQWALKEPDIDYVFDNVGFSLSSDMFSLPIRDDVRQRAEKTLAERKGMVTKMPEQISNEKIQSEERTSEPKLTNQDREKTQEAVQGVLSAPRETRDSVANDPNKNDYAHVKMPANFIQTYQFKAQDGRQFDKAYVHFPAGVTINGVALGGYSCDVFMSDKMMQQKLQNEDVTLSFKTAEPVSVWTGKKDDTKHPYKCFTVKAWDLVRALKTERESFNAAHQSGRSSLDRPGEKEGVSLSACARESREASHALGQHQGCDTRQPER